MAMQTVQYVPQIKCAHCHGYHTSVDDVKECSRIQRVGRLSAVPPAAPEQSRWRDPVVDQSPNTPISRLVTRGSTVAQLQYIHDLGGNAFAARLLTLEDASKEITRLKGEKVSTKPMFEMKIPPAMLANVPDGYYGVQADSDDPVRFFRVSRPKKGPYAGSIKIQSQHGENLKNVLVVRPDGSNGYWFTGRSVETYLLMIVVDPTTAMIKYADELKQCCRCRKLLTDERSRWYGIGPDCEKVYPHIIEIVDDRKGSYDDRY